MSYSTVPKAIINIFFLLVILITSLPVKQASRLFFKKQVQAEMCDDCCDDAPVKKADDSIGFKEFPACHPFSAHALLPVVQLTATKVAPADWRLPLWPAVEVHTPPPNYA